MAGAMRWRPALRSPRTSWARCAIFWSSASATASCKSGSVPSRPSLRPFRGRGGGPRGGVFDPIAALAPFGAATPEPRIAFPGVQLAFVEPVGTGHLRCTFADPIGPAKLRAIAFRVGETPLGEFLLASRGRAIHVAGHLRRDDYRGGGGRRHG